ncbi:MAG: hypothetical protein H7098_13650 [Oligoflexus sp.]|nr:hypothetical protein [Pseudopedobacter sp.]
MQNIKFNYLYRDAGNYKFFGSVIFSNPYNLSLDNIQLLLKNPLINGEWFIAEDLKLSSLFFDKHIADLDHLFHEFETVLFTEEESKSSLSINEFINLLQKANWNY